MDKNKPLDGPGVSFGKIKLISIVIWDGGSYGVPGPILVILISMETVFLTKVHVYTLN